MLVEHRSLTRGDFIEDIPPELVNNGVHLLIYTGVAGEFYAYRMDTLWCEVSGMPSKMVCDYIVRKILLVGRGIPFKSWLGKWMLAGSKGSIKMGIEYVEGTELAITQWRWIYRIAGLFRGPTVMAIGDSFGHRKNLLVHVLHHLLLSHHQSLPNVMRHQYANYCVSPIQGSVSIPSKISATFSVSTANYLWTTFPFCDDLDQNFFCQWTLYHMFFGVVYIHICTWWLLWLSAWDTSVGREWKLS